VLETKKLALSWILLALGAPFWFDALKNSLKLRSWLRRRTKGENRAASTAASMPPDGDGDALAQLDLVIRRPREPAPEMSGDFGGTGRLGGWYGPDPQTVLSENFHSDGRALPFGPS
jgi:hypothetical protein